MSGAQYDQESMMRAAEALRSSGGAVVLTGAGISVESGIPDFRSPGGIWSKYPPEEYATIDAFYANPDRVWELWYELADSLRGVKPNPAHVALAELEERGVVQAIITQNIDALHFHGGSVNVVEYHGNMDWLVCPACHRRRKLGLDQRALGAPRCECGGYMKPDIVLFGEVIPHQALHHADTLARRCGVFMVVGTSALVYPAAHLPRLAKENGAVVIECNTAPTGLTDDVTDIFLEGPAGVTLPALARLVLGE